MRISLNPKIFNAVTQGDCKEKGKLASQVGANPF
jgi:hypothetical protein